METQKQQLGQNYYSSSPINQIEIIKQLANKSGIDPIEMFKIIQNSIPQQQQQQQDIKYPKIIHLIENNEKQQKHKYNNNGEEIYCDSGNETSSLSPGHTSPMTGNSPHSSLPGSRSNSFSVSNILRTDISIKMKRNENLHQ
ncbi:Nuclear receptor domain-containing protein [Meloidogyne graminicola]|uniref:Nuclear receptor domain-containing protein n=1 Tax=Meloidogyne graminicola TaxID=189291 RepID=A0A8S9ZSQ2_9BILA|nr:Nuclear receptor domain-containing protein [Meloidogyne graminicola]